MDAGCVCSDEIWSQEQGVTALSEQFYDFRFEYGEKAAKSLFEIEAAFDALNGPWWWEAATTLSHPLPATL